MFEMVNRSELISNVVALKALLPPKDTLTYDRWNQTTYPMTGRRLLFPSPTL